MPSHPHSLARKNLGIWPVRMILGRHMERDFFFLQQALELQRDSLFDYHYISQSPNIFDLLQFARHHAWHLRE